MWSPVEEETGPVLVLAWLLGNGMNLSPLAGFCTFILMIGQVLILPFLKFLNSWSDRSIDPPDSGIQPRISPTTEFHTVPADPSGQLSNRQCLARPFSTHPLPGGCAVFIAVSTWDSLKELGGNKSTNPQTSLRGRDAHRHATCAEASLNSLQIWPMVSSVTRETAALMV